MPTRRLIIYCDESTDRGRFFSHFYGGALINASDRDAVEHTLNNKKRDLNLLKEIKWTYITENYERKYIDFIDCYFNLIKSGKIKIRIMFTQNIHVPVGLDDYQIDNQFFLLYYQLIKHAFGLRYSNPGEYDAVFVSLYLDDVPDTREKFQNFKDYVYALCHYPVFSRARINIPREEITEVKSGDHVILQGLDIILGAMQFRLNDRHKEKPIGRNLRGKRTRAKERVYNYINSRIRSIYPGFNIGITTGLTNDESDRWHHPYRHWRFIPSDYRIDPQGGKQRQARSK